MTSRVPSRSPSPSPSTPDMYSFTVKEDFYIMQEVLKSKVLHDYSTPELAKFEKILAWLIEKGCFDRSSAPTPSLLREHFWSVVNFFRACDFTDRMVEYNSEEELKYIPLCLSSLKKIASSLRGEEHRSSTCNHPPPSAPDLVSHNRPHGSYPMYPYQPFYPHPSIYHQHYHHNYPPPPTYPSPPDHAYHSAYPPLTTYPHHSFYPDPPFYAENPLVHPTRSATAPAPSARVVPAAKYPFRAPSRAAKRPAPSDASGPSDMKRRKTDLMPIAKATAPGKDQPDAAVKRVPGSPAGKERGPTPSAVTPKKKKGALSSAIRKTRRVVVKPKENTPQDVSDTSGLNEDVQSILADVRQFLLQSEGHDARGNNEEGEDEGRAGDPATSDRAVKFIGDLKCLVEEEASKRKELRLMMLGEGSLKCGGGREGSSGARDEAEKVAI